MELGEVIIETNPQLIWKSILRNGIGITVLSSGIYEIKYSTSYQSTNLDTVHWAVHKGATKLSQCSSETKILGTNSIVTTNGVGLASLAANDQIKLLVTSSTNGTVISVNHASLTLNRIAG